MNIRCKLLGHAYDYELFGFLFCTRCTSRLDLRWVKREHDRDRAAEYLVKEAALKGKKED